MTRIVARTALVALAALSLAACRDPIRPPSAGRPGRPNLFAASGSVWSMTVKDLGILSVGPTGGHSVALALNDSGVVTGFSSVAFSNETAVFRWSKNGPMQWAGGQYGSGVAINDSGQIAIDRTYIHDVDHRPSYRLDPDGLLTEVCAFTTLQVEECDAKGIDPKGNVIGGVADKASHYYGFWQPPVGAATVVSPPNATASVALAVNRSGQVAGLSTDPNSDDYRAWRYTPGTASYEYLAPASPGSNLVPRAISDAGSVAGYSYVGTVDKGVTPFRWTASGGLVALSQPGSNGAAFGINSNGYVAGYVASDASGATPVLWDWKGVRRPLPRLAGAAACSECAALAINNRLQIAGADVAPNGEIHAVLWTVKVTTHLSASMPQPIYYPPGLLPLTVYSTADVDAARDIPPQILTLGDGTGPGTPVARDRTGRPLAALQDVNGDGRLDLVVQFDGAAMARAGTLTTRTTRLVLAGDFGDGTSVESTIPVRVVAR